jgi:hypothetical protein
VSAPVAVQRSPRKSALSRARPAAIGSHPVIDLAHPDADRSLGYRDQQALALAPPAGICGHGDGRAAFAN